MYNEVKLEKGMYHLANKSFLQALEEADPQAQYAQTPLARLDAYERQLKRFDIRVSGPSCDRVEKFFTTTESAVLFPEFVRRSVLQGMQEAVLPEITAAVSHNITNRYQGCSLTDTAEYTTTKPGDEMPVSTISEGTAIAVLKAAGNSSAVTISGEALAYSDLAALYGLFKSCDLTTILASPAVVAQILVMNQMLETSSEDCTEIRLPFGAKLVKCAQLDDTFVLGLDKNFALEMIQSSDVVLETDKLISCQLDSIGISVSAGFRTLIADAVKMLKLA